MRVTVIIPPAPIVTWEEADQQLHLDAGEEQRPHIERLIKAATQHIDGPDGWLGRALGPQTLEARMCGFCDIIRLPYRPVIDIVSVHYLDGQGQPQLVAADSYELFGHDLGSAWGKSWPTPGAYRGYAETVRIQYRAGYPADPEAEPLEPDVPEPIKQAILLMVGDMYRFTETASDMNIAPTSIPMSTTVENLLSPFRVYA
ncbi:head-tail connector protein [Sphingobium sp. WCS2017Hpa-17]|uniref:head-tail connector protein n=1 Tax=Sphingobium sp. WCS2017Hpa-17 TaxID=3073638 RepID=UPI00288BA54A|nr:head-tail connector protein [Sphingobium sp. WCS2017Hpa-17]